MDPQKEYKKPPVHKRIIFWIVLPVIIVGTAISGVLTTFLSPQIESFLINNFEANLRLSSSLGLDVCDTQFNQLLDMRLENNVEMNTTLKGEALEQIKRIEKQVPLVHMIVLENSQFIKMISIDYPKDTWGLPSSGNTEDVIWDTMLGGKNIKAHIRYFPYWGWHIISFVFENDSIAPLATAKQIVYFSTMVILVTVFLTILFMFNPN